MSTQGGPAGVGALVLAEDVLRACFLEPMAPSYIKIGRNHVCITSGPERETNKLVPIIVEIFLFLYQANTGACAGVTLTPRA